MRPPPEPSHPFPAIPDPNEGELVLDDLWVRYGDGPWVLRGVNARLPARGLISLSGDSGAGKSTLLGVLLGFLPADRGQVRLDGRPIAAQPSAVGWVPQSLDLMRGSVRDNVTLGRDIRDERLLAVLESVGMRAPIEALPGGLDHPLDEDGSGLSGGQRQRLSIARAVLGRPRVLLLDEPTAALDAAAERALVDTLITEARQRLVLAVAHRPALTEAADEAFDLVNGRWLAHAPSGDPGASPERQGSR